MDLNKFYELLPNEDQKKINAIILKYLKDCAISLGGLIDPSPVNAEPRKTESKKHLPANSNWRNKERFRVKWPIKLHGRSIPNPERLSELYSKTEGLWDGVYSWKKVRCLMKDGFKPDEIFPEPPSNNEFAQTIVKRTDDDGQKYFVSN